MPAVNFMKIIAIDPGTAQSAIVEWDGAAIIGHDIEANEPFRDDFCEMMADAPPDLVAIEMVQSFGMPVGREIFETVLHIGRLVEICHNHVPCRLIYRQEVKQHLCHSARAKDSNIRQALIDRFGPPGLKKSPGLTYGLKADTWQAFALAVTAFDTHDQWRAARMTELGR